MREGRLALLWFMIGLVASQDADFTPVCDFSQSSGPPVPDLPDQFSFTIEGNLIERNSTAIMTEYYDGPGNRGRLEFGFNASLGIGIFDYDLGEIFLIPDFRTGDDCRVYPIVDNPRFLNFTFGVENRNGSIHIGSPSTFVEALRDDSITQYVGEDMVRGIPTQRWQACVNRENISYLIDYYFATEPWNYEGQGQKLDSTQMVPVQFTLNTTRISNSTIRNIYHIYTVVDFRAGPESVSDSLFRVPNGLACTGRFPGQPVPQIPQFFSASLEQVYSVSPIPSVQTVREFYDVTHQLFRTDYYNSGRRYGTRGPNTVIHDFSTSVQYLISTQVANCSVISLDVAAPYLFDVTRNDDGSFQLVSPNNLFLRGNEFNYSYEGVSNIRGVDVDSWVSVRDFERITDYVNLTDAVYEIFFTRPGWAYTTTHSINTDPVPWRIKVTGTFSYINSSNATVQMDSTYVMDLFDFSTDEPPYDAFDISSCSDPDDFYTMILIIPGQERGIDLGQLRRNIRTSVTNYTGLRPLQIGNIQIVSENGTHIFVTFQISNLTSLAKIDPARIVTAQQAVDYITSNTVGSQLPFRIQISPNVSVTPSLRVAGRGPAPTACNDSFCDCSVPLVDPDGTCSTPNCATPPDIPSYFSVTVQQIDQHTRPPSAQTYKEFYDYGHNLFRFDTYYDGSFGGFAEPVSIIHDLNSSVQYVIGNQFRFCFAQPLQESAPFFWDLTTDDGGTLQLVSPNNIFFRGPNYSYTYQGATNVRGVDVDSWLSYRSFEQIAPAFNLSDAYYQVFFTRPGWSFPIVQSVTDQPVPWRIIINGTLTTVNRTDNSTYSFFSTFYMDLYEFSTNEPPYDAFDISSCSAPDDYYTVVLFIPGNETGVDLGQLRRNIRTSVMQYTGLRPLQIGNIQIIRENGTHFDVTFQISNLSSLAQIDPTTNVTAQQAVDLITGGTTVGSNQLPFQIQISPSVMVTPTFFVLGRGPNVSRDRCMNNTNNTNVPPPQPCNCSMSECNATQCQRYCSSQTNQTNTCNNATNIASRLSNGAVAGIAIALFILGILVGIILQLVLGLVVRWCRSSSGSFKIGDSVKYKKQEDDLKIT